jgi:hypothetical protein
MNELSYEEMALIVSSAIGCSITALAAVLPHMTFLERQAILRQAQTLNALQGKETHTNV